MSSSYARVPVSSLVAKPRHSASSSGPWRRNPELRWHGTKNRDSVPLAWPSWRGDEFKRVCANVHIGDGLLDLRHMAGHAFVAGTSGRVVRMRFDRRRVRAVRRIRAMAFQAHYVRRLQQVRIVFGAMHIVATEAAHAVRVHLAGNEVVALHPVLVRRSVREMRERLLAELVLFQLPEILQILARLEADRPVVILARRSDSSAAAPANGTECRRRWLGRNPAARD